MSDERDAGARAEHQALIALCRAHGLGLSADEVPEDPNELFEHLASTGASSAEGRRLQLARALGGVAAARRHETAEPLADETEVARLEQELRDAIDECARLRSRTAGLLAALDAGALVCDGDGRVVDANASASAMTGLTPAALLEVALAPLLERLDTDTDVDVRRRSMPDGDSQLVLVRRRAAGADPAADDVYERLAVLTHKINNPLTSLLGRTQILQVQRRDDPVLIKALAVICDSAQRIATLVREVATIAREGKLDTSQLTDPDR